MTSAAGSGVMLADPARVDVEFDAHTAAPHAAAPAAPSADRLRFLDGLRGYSCVSVLLWHAGYDVLMSSPTAWVYALSPFACGRFAVCVFFAVSGFSLACVRAPDRLLVTALARWPRLALPVLAATQLAWLLGPQRTGLAGLVLHPLMTCFYAFFPAEESYQNTLVVRQLTNSGFTMSRFFQLWTMPIELRGSALVFAWTLAQGRVARRWTLLAGVAALATLCDLYLVYFAAGIALRHLFLGRWRDEAAAAAAGGPEGVRAAERRGQYAAAVFAALHYGVQLPLRTEHAARRDFEYGQLRFAAWHAASLVRIVALFYAIALWPRARAALECRAAAFLGRASYSMYLLHNVVSVVLRHYVAVADDSAAARRHGERALLSVPRPLLCLVSTALAVAAGAAFAPVDAWSQRASKRAAQWLIAGGGVAAEQHSGGASGADSGQAGSPRSADAAAPPM